MRFCVCFAALCCLILVLSDQYQGGNALKIKKKIGKVILFKKLKELLPLLLAMKGKKKLLVLPIPIPIKIKKNAKTSWPPMPAAWPSQPPQISWPTELTESWPSAESWPSMPQTESWPSMAPQSAPPTKQQVSSYLPSDFNIDPNTLKQSIEQYLTTYSVRDGPGLNYNSAYNPPTVGQSYLSSAFPRPQLEARRPPSKSQIKKPAQQIPFGLPKEDDYEQGKGGSAAAYNEIANGVAKSQQVENTANRVQFQSTSVSGDYSGGGSSPNEISYDDNRLSNQAVDTVSNDGSYEESSNELVNDSVKATNTEEKVTFEAPAIRLQSYKKKSKV